MSQEITKNVQVPVVMAAVLWKALRNNNCPEMDLLASCMISQGLEIEGSAEEVYDYYKEYLIANGLLQEESDITQ